eukprot:TRINITY_DN31013_c0_g1_i1.p2 TRINITY_DN31013_c0_g1~~TRINITY_DN31013_c0_g1_i1.p2  ORF type:complete len:313 (-),score=108.93 TRINITY_DN31013_c0_g1_i1:105-1043(-)
MASRIPGISPAVTMQCLRSSWIKASLRTVSRPNFKSYSTAGAVDLHSIILEPDTASKRNVLVFPGLYGSGSNWRGTARKLMSSGCEQRFHLIDLRNHGNSPHTAHMTWQLMMADVSQYIQRNGLKHVSIIGHSLGGRLAMLYALHHPDALEKLVIVDITPAAYNQNFEIFSKYIAFMRDIKVSGPDGRREAEEHLKKVIPDRGIRQFLLTNLIEMPEVDGVRQFKWRLNFDGLANSMLELQTFAAPSGLAFQRDTLFVGGAKSNYIQPGHHALLFQHFPNARVEMIEGAGHWPHADAPDRFVDIVGPFLRKR